MLLYIFVILYTIPCADTCILCSWENYTDPETEFSKENFHKKDFFGKHCPKTQSPNGIRITFPKNRYNCCYRKEIVMIRKQLTLWSCLFLFIVSLKAQESTAIGTIPTFKGDPLQVTEYIETDASQSVLISKMLFSKGKIIKKDQFTPEGTLQSTIEYLYSPENLLIEIKGISPQGETESTGTQLKWKYTYEYNDQKQLVSETSWNAQGQQEWTKSSLYSPQGQLVTQKTVKADGTVTLQVNYTYNPDGTKSREETLYGDGKLLKRVIFEYNQESILTKELHYDSAGLYETIAYTYENGQVISVGRYGSTGNLKEVQYRVYENGNVIKTETHNAEGTYIAQEEFAWDSQGNMLYWKTGRSMTRWEYFYGEE